ncbi:MAG: hypothetical protein ABL878_15030 [Burkholderiales bacterium]
MKNEPQFPSLNRRTLLRGAAALGAAQLAGGCAARSGSVQGGFEIFTSIGAENMLPQSINLKTAPWMAGGFQLSQIVASAEMPDTCGSTAALRVTLIGQPAAFTSPGRCRAGGGGRWRRRRA